MMGTPISLASMQVSGQTYVKNSLSAHYGNNIQTLPTRHRPSCRLSTQLGPCQNTLPRVGPQWPGGSDLPVPAATEPEFAAIKLLLPCPRALSTPRAGPARGCGSAWPSRRGLWCPAAGRPGEVQHRGRCPSPPRCA